MRPTVSRSIPFPRLSLTAAVLVTLAVPSRLVLAAESAHFGPTKVDCASVNSSIFGRPVDYCVALPADYDSSPNRHYPTLYYLHGLFENERSWADKGGKDILDNLLAQGQAGEFLVVMPNGGRTFYINSSDGHERYEDFFIQEFVPTIDKTYRTLAEPSERGISGTSMGGFGALHLAMKHPDIFGSASAQSAALIPKFPDPLPSEGRWGFYARVLEGPFGSPLNESYFEASNPLTLAEHPEKFSGVKLYFDVGDHDRYGFREGNEMLDHVLSSKGFPHEFVLRPGDHGWSYLTQYMQYALSFEWKCFGVGTAIDSPPPKRKVSRH